MDNMADLMRLRIPQGWAVSDNKFYDTDPIFDDTGFITNWYEGFIEDVLWIQESRFIDEAFRSPEYHCFDIDISWLIQDLENRSGAYFARLTYTNTDESHEVDALESTDRFAIRDRIESWMDDISENYPVRKEEMKARYPDPEL